MTTQWIRATTSADPDVMTQLRHDIDGADCVGDIFFPMNGSRVFGFLVFEIFNFLPTFFRREA